MNRRDAHEVMVQRVAHIRFEIDQSVDIVARGREEFDGDFVLGYAGTKLLENIGEAIASIQSAYSMEGNDMPAPLDGLDVPWRAIKGMRNNTAHQYWKIDLGVVWDALETDLPQLGAALDTISFGSGTDS